MSHEVFQGRSDVRLNAHPVAHVAAAVLLLAASCASRTAPHAADASARPAAAHAPYGAMEEEQWSVERRKTMAERAPAIRDAPPIERLLCAKRRCCITELDDLGRDRGGQELLVARLDLERVDCLLRPPPAPFGSGRLDHPPAAARPKKANVRSREQAEVDPDKRCRNRESHLVVRRGGRVRSVALLSATCEDLGGQSTTDGGDFVEVDKERKILSHGRVDVSRQSDDRTVSVGLDPLRRASELRHVLWMNDGSEITRSEWDWDKFSGTAEWTAVDCKRKERAASGGAERDAGVEGGVDPGGKAEDTEGALDLTTKGVLIPAVDLPAAFVANGWRTTGLGACAAFMDGSASGYTIHGSEDGGEASLRALINERTLFVEVSDDRFVGPGDNWVKDDHLELWLGEAWIGDRSRCEARGAERMAQWGIRVADGAVFPAHGASAALPGVERVVIGRTARFKIPLPDDAGARITIVYSDSDDGRRQERLISSSELRFGNAATLGETFVVEPQVASCVVSEGVLRPKLVPLRPKPGVPVTQGLL